MANIIKFEQFSVKDRNNEGVQHDGTFAAFDEAFDDLLMDLSKRNVTHVDETQMRKIYDEFIQKMNDLI